MESPFKSDVLKRKITSIVIMGRHIQVIDDDVSTLRFLGIPAMSSPGKIVEVRTVIDKEVVWVPSMVIKELEGERLLVKENNGEESTPETIVDASFVRPTPPSYPVKEFKMFENVEVRCGLGWRRGLVRGVLNERRYVVSFEAIKMESVFQHSFLRPFLVWEDGIWRAGPKGKTPSDVVKEKLMTPKTASRRALNIDESGAQVTSIANESVSPVTPVRPIEIETNGKTPEPTMNQNDDSGSDKLIEEEILQVNSRKRKTEQQDNAELNESELASDQSPNGAAAATPRLLLPFKKESPYWKGYKSLEGFKSVPQHPHFSPLFEARDDIREWSAVGMMETFYLLLDEVKAMKINDPSRKLDELIGSFAKLEKYGFDIAMPRERMSKVLSLRDEWVKKGEEMKCLENKIEEEEGEKLKMEQKRAMLKREILELEKEDRIAEEMEEASARRMVEMEASASRIDKEIQDIRVEFEKTISEFNGKKLKDNNGLVKCMK